MRFEVKVLAWMLVVCGCAWGDDAADKIPMNHIQAIGTHNSYHVATTSQSASFTGNLSKQFGWDYTHPTLDVQLDHGVRGLELDVYAHSGETLVMHVPIYDTGTTCKTFTAGLKVVRDWSGKHGRHVPIVILVELKIESIPFANVLPFDEAALDQLDVEVRSVFTPDRLVTPDDVRGDMPTLAQAVEEKGWPTLGWARGRVMLVLHTRGKPAELYAKNRPSLQGRTMMMESQEGAPFAAVFILNNPQDPRIPELVKRGYFVRTTGDGGRKAEGAAATEHIAMALASGAQLVTTDYPEGETDTKMGYTVRLPERTPARCNPSLAPDKIPAADVDR